MKNQFDQQYRIPLIRVLQKMIKKSLLFFIASMPIHGSGQCVPVEFPSYFCDQAPFVCLNQYCAQTENISLPCCIGWCGQNTVIDNAQYLEFLATSPNIAIDIHVNYCESGAGLQSGIIDECPWNNSNVVDCNSGTPPNGTMSLRGYGLTPGQVYWVFIDGINRSVCSYTITYTSGIFDGFELAELLPELTHASDTIVCPGFSSLHVETGSTWMDANTYIWETSWDGSIFYSSNPEIDLQVPYNTPDGMYNICIRGASGCDTTDALCLPIEVRSLPDRIKDTASVCQNEFPFTWSGNIISGPGTYTHTFNEGPCLYDSVWTVLAIPLPAEGMTDTIVCDLSFDYEGRHYSQSGDYVLNYPGQSYRGCDSIAHLHLELHYTDAFVEVHCMNGQMILKTRITEQDESVDTLAFAWYTCNFDTLLSTEPDLYPGASGCYTLIIDAGSCPDTISSFYSMDPCLDTCSFIAGAGCVDENMLLSLPQSLQGEDQVDWIIAIPGQPTIHFKDQDSVYVTIPTAGHYEALVTFKNEEDTYTCKGYFEVVAGPSVTLCCDQTFCKDSCGHVVINNLSGVPANVSFTNGYSVLGILNSASLLACPVQGHPLEFTIRHVTLSGLGCMGEVIGDSSVTIQVADPPMVSLFPLADTLCAYPDNLAAYTWRYCDSTDILGSGNCFAPPASGCYCLDVENEFGCLYTTCTDFILSATTSFSQDELQLFPNPASGTIQVHFPGAINLPVEWQLADSYGIIVKKGSLVATKNQLDISNIPAGFYLLTFIFGDGSILVRKIIIH